MLATILFVSGAVNAQVLSYNDLPVLKVSTPIPQSTHVPGDVDGDGFADLLWFNPQTSQFAYWLMRTDELGHASRVGSRTINVTPGYVVGAVGDFNGDGKTDVFFTSAANDLWLWTSNGTSFVSQQSYDYPAGWKLVGAGDIDGDGRDDLLWTNDTTCQFAYWLMNGATRIGSRVMDVTCGYRPVAIGYFSPVNRLSIIWQGSAGDTWIWDSKAGGFSSHHFVDVDPAYNILSLGGGRFGTNIGMVIQTNAYTRDSFGNLNGQVGASLVTRQFDANLEQVQVQVQGLVGGGANLPAGSAGYTVAPQGLGAAGLIYVNGIDYQPRWLSMCTVAAAMPGDDTSCTRLDYPATWHVIGAEASQNAYAADPTSP